MVQKISHIWPHSNVQIFLLFGGNTFQRNISFCYKRAHLCLYLAKRPKIDVQVVIKCTSFVIFLL